MYHKSCITAEWQKWKLKSSQNPSKSIENGLENPKNLQFIAAKIQCHSQLQEKNVSGEFVPINEAENDYECIMNQYNLSFTKNRSALKDKIQECISNVEITQLANRSNLA